MREKDKLGVDVDEVVVEFFKKYLELFNKQFNKKMSLKDITNYHIWNLTDISREDSLLLAREVHDAEHPDNLLLVDGVEKSLVQLSKKYEIFFITSRPERFKEKTTQTLKHLFKDFRFSLHFAQGVWGSSKTKGDICRELGVKFMVEDNADYALDCAQKGIKTFLLDKPWNQKYESNPNLIKVKSWDEILNYLEKEK